MVVTWTFNAGTMRLAAEAAVVLVLCLLTGLASGQRRGASHSARPPMRSYSAPRPQNSFERPQYQQRRAQQYQRPSQGRQARQQQPRSQARPQQPRSQARQVPRNQPRSQGNTVQRPAPGYPSAGPRPLYRGGAGPGSPSSGSARAPYIPGAAPPGHLGDWLNRHGNLPIQQQEKVLRSDPSFKRLPRADQQRLMQQLSRVDQMPPAQRERRLARNEAIEHLSPKERANLNLSERRWNTLPSNRQALMKQAFQDLRGVPLDQRQTVLNSSHYQNVFTPEERGILSNFLRVEPYQPPR